jgi:intron-binding protein aquarius
MPTAKRLKSGGNAKAKASTARPTTAELDGDAEFAQLAKQHWLKTTRRTAKVKVKNDVLKQEIWDGLEKEGFPLKSLLALESLQILEKYAGASLLLIALDSNRYIATFGLATRRTLPTITYC